ncbi:MAG: SufE family protein [Methyloligellaceae bacterium]
MTIPRLNELLSDFEILDDWEDRYKYVIELGNMLPELDEDDRTSENKVQGCASQVWIKTDITDGNLHFTGDSDALIVRGLIAILMSIYQDKPAKEIATIDAKETLEKLGLKEHLTSQRSNGLFSMVERIQRDANTYLAA